MPEERKKTRIDHRVKYAYRGGGENELIKCTTCPCQLIILRLLVLISIYTCDAPGF
jgi:hypothetical protein